VEDFLDESGGIDVWRKLFPNLSGYTYKNTHLSTFSRLDYFLVSPLLLQSTTAYTMRLGNWSNKLDHVKISFLSALSANRTSRRRCKPWSIPQPRLAHASAEQKNRCKREVNQALIPIVEKIREAKLSLEEVDKISEDLAHISIQTSCGVLGRKLPTHEKGKYQSLHDLI